MTAQMMGLTDAPEINANDLILAREMAEALHSAFPGHLWAVSIDGTMATIRNMALAGNWGFRLSLPAMYSASEFKKRVIKGGGELLERFRVARTRQGAEQAWHIPMDIYGRKPFDK